MKEKKNKPIDATYEAEEIPPLKEEADIFMEASMQSFKSTSTKTITLSETKTVQEGIKEVNELLYKPPTKGEWAKLKKDLDGVYAKKFNDILMQLPDREFVRVYMKVLEFTKPKIIRESREKGKQGDTTINIQINRGNAKN